MAFRGPVCVGIFGIAVVWLSRRVSKEILAGLSVASCLAVTWLFLASGHYLSDLARIQKSLEERYEPALQQTKPDQLRKYDEGLTYYAASKSLETNADLVTPLLRSFAIN